MQIIFYRGPEGLFGNLVRLWTWSKYSHCEIEFSPAPGEGRGVRCSALSAGVCWRPPLTGAQLQYWDAIPLVATEAQEIALKAWCTEQIGDPYDWPGILFSEVFPFERHAESKWFCSELCCAAAQRLGYLMGRYTGISPKRLYNSLPHVDLLGLSR